MAIFSKAHNALSAEVSRLEALKALQDDLKRAGSMERLIKEVEEKKAAAEADLAKVLSRIKAAERTVDEFQQHIEAQRAASAAEAQKAKEAADRILAEARELKVKAGAEAEAILAKAKGEADGILARVNANADAVQKESDALAKANAQAKDELEATRQRKADVEAEIARLKALFGGRA